VQSPQFLNATWRFGYHLVQNGGGIKVTQLQSYGAPTSPDSRARLTCFTAARQLSRTTL
jgi:phosphomevalonate kinase